jgi:hypothetical protein
MLRDKKVVGVFVRFRAPLHISQMVEREQKGVTESDYGAEVKLQEAEGEAGKRRARWPISNASKKK